MLPFLSRVLQAKRLRTIVDSCSSDGEFQDDPLLSSKERTDQFLPSPMQKRGIASLLTLGVLATVVSGFSFMAGALLFRAMDVNCTERLWTYSPLLSAVKYHEVTLDNQFRKETIYRGTPTLEGDKAWNKLWYQPSFNVPEAKLLALNFSADTTWRHTPQEFGGGVEGQAEIFHQLHCLNMIRQYTYYDHYKQHNILPTEFSSPDGLLRTHVDHCIETLRLHIMCFGDTTVIPFKLDSTVKLGYSVEFNTRHMCRDFDALVDWGVANGIPADRVFPDPL